MSHCHYHLQRKAITKCARCSRNICFDDKRLYRDQHSSFIGDNPISGIGENLSSYVKTLEYCILCNATALRNDINPIKIILYLIPFILFTIIVSVLYPPSTIVFSAFSIVFIIIYIFQVLKARKAENEAMLFKESLKIDEYSSTYGFLTSKGGISNIDDNAQIDIYSTRTSKVGTKRPAKEQIFHMVCWQCGSGLELSDKFCRICGDSTKKELEKFKDEHPDYNKLNSK